MLRKRSIRKNGQIYKRLVANIENCKSCLYTGKGCPSDNECSVGYGFSPFDRVKYYYYYYAPKTTNDTTRPEIK